MNKEDFLKENLNFLFGVFTVFNEVRKNESLLGRDIFKILNTSLARTLIMGLSALTDFENRNDPVSIYSLKIPIILSETHKKIIKNIRKIRDQMLAHNDSDAVLRSEEFLKEHELLFEQAGILLEYLITQAETHLGRKIPREIISKRLRSQLYSLLGN